MNRQEYNACVGAGLKGKTLGKEERKLEFCIVSKTCSGKAKDREEAKYLCSLPKEPKPAKVKRGTKHAIDSNTLATCIIKALDGSEISLTNLTPIIASCTGQKVEKPLTRERFIKKCFKENAVTGDIKEAQKLRSLCTARWKAQEISNEAG